MSEKRPTSSVGHSLVKMLFLTLAILVGCMFIGSALPALLHGQLTTAHLVLGLGTFFTSVMAIAVRNPLSRVSHAYTDDEFLYVPRLFKTVAIPLDLIASATETISIFGRGRAIQVRLFEPTPFGSEITFGAPATNWLWAWDQPHPLVVELNNIASHNQARRHK